MFEYLRQHAIENVWCHPEQDNQVILAAKRITPEKGVFFQYPVMSRTISLPTPNKTYHLFQVGQVMPEILGLLPIRPMWAKVGWKTLQEAVKTLPVYCDAYVDRGVKLALFNTYCLYTSERALIFAVEEHPKMPVLFSAETVYFRFYTNAYYESILGANQPKKTETQGRIVQDNTQIVALQNQVITHRAMHGAVLCFVNGHLVDNIDLVTTKPGDLAEFVYDASIKRIVDLKIGELRSFLSDLDGNFKYLLHYPYEGEEVIDYLDDVDVYIIHKTGNRCQGRFYHRNRPEAIRMVTHRDYSLTVDYVRNIGHDYLQWKGLPLSEYENLYIRLYVRDSGLVRPLVFDHHRIFELYKLNDEDIVDAMIGTVAEVELWRAPVLEQNGYTRLMRSNYTDININLIEEAYGYNAIAKLLGDGPVRTQVLSGSSHTARLPIGAYQVSTVYEYDQHGNLLLWRNHQNSTTYYPTSPLTRRVEPVIGRGQHEDLAIYGQNHLPIPDGFSYRVYMCYLVGGVPNQQWRDITDGPLYHIHNNTLVWNDLELDQWLMIRSDETFLAYEFDLEAVAGTFHFALSEYVDGELYRLQVPPGDLDLWLNGKSLIKGLDYVIHFPEVHIVSKTHLMQPAGSSLQRVTVRGRGFAKSDLSMESSGDYGFIEHGLLSNNDQFDLRDDKVLRITVGGQLKLRDEVQFSEEHSGVSVVNALNGTPYQVKDVVVPLRGFTAEETYRLREEALVFDAEVKAYLTQKLPQPPREAVSAIPNRYPLLSPFFSHIVNDLQSGRINSSVLNSTLTDQDIMALCEEYEPLLDFDPINAALAFDHRYVVVHPHQLNNTIGLDIAAYRFLQRVAGIYGQGLIKLNHFINITTGA